MSGLDPVRLRLGVALTRGGRRPGKPRPFPDRPQLHAGRAPRCCLAAARRARKRVTSGSGSSTSTMPS
ncbi:protein of unknown function [Burkholderia multivorans]